MTVDLASYNEGVRAGRRERQTDDDPELTAALKAIYAKYGTDLGAFFRDVSAAKTRPPAPRGPGRDELLELARQWVAEANHLRQVANNFDQRGMLNSGLISRTQGNQMTECANQLTRLLRVEDATDDR